MSVVRRPRSAVRWTSCAIAAFALAIGAPAVTPLVEQASAATWSTVVDDSFSRTVSTGWGSANSSLNYSVQPATGTSVAADAGLMSNLKTGASVAAALPVGLSDVHVRSSVSVTGANTADLYHSWRVREVGKSRYDLTMRANSGGSVTVNISRIVDGQSTWLGGARIAATPLNGNPLWLEGEVTGTSPVSIAVRAWQGSTTPAYQATYTDSSSSRLTAAGAVAITDYVASTDTAMTLRHDDVLVQRAVSGQTDPGQPPAQPEQPADGSRGTTLGSQSYSIPAGATFVDPARGNDSATGTQSAPFRTVAKAISSSSNGGTIILRAGTYHESVTVDKTVTIQNYPREVAWFDGSRSVSNWTKSGSTWVSSGWTPTFSSSMGGDSAFRARFLASGYPMAANPDQVFIDGKAQRQVGSSGSVASGAFYVDGGGDKLYLGSDPSGRDVRASDLAQAIRVIAPNTVLRGFGVRRYATPYESRGAVQMDATGGTFSHMLIQDNATIGLALSKYDKVVDHVVVERNGMMGVGLDRGDRFTASNSILRDNNSEHFKPQPVAGGIKITSTNTLRLENNDVSDNNEGLGIWLDVYSSNFTIAGNTLKDNGEVQMEIEMSANGIVANNDVRGGTTGIRIYDSEKVKVFNNEIGTYSLFAFNISQDARWKSSAKSGFSLKVNAIAFSNNVIGCGKTFQFYARDGETNISADKMSLTITGNLFSKRVATSDPTMVAWGAGDNSTVVRYETPAALAAAKNSGWSNAQTSTCGTVESMSAAVSAAAGTATPLPSDVAAAMRTQAGRKIVGNL